MKYLTNGTGIYTIFHKKHYVVGGQKGRVSQSVIFTDSD